MKRTMMILGLFIAACGSDVTGNPAGLRIMVTMSPNDISTGDSPAMSLQFFFSGSLLEFPVDQRSAVAETARLTSMRSGADVPLQFDLTERDGRALDMTFAPRDGLPLSGWYTFEVTLPHESPSGPGGATFYLPATVSRDSGDATVYQTRFYSGSLPLLVGGAGQDPNDARSFLVGVGATEGVEVSAAGGIESIVTITSGETIVRCSLADPTSVSRELGQAGLASFRCSGVDARRPLRISVRPGLVSLSGVPLRDMNGSMDPAEITWTPTDAEYCPREPGPTLFDTVGP